MYDRKNEEFAADFLLIARRHLDERDHKLFRYHYVLGADWKLCCVKLGIDRGLFFHGIYRIQQKLGKAFKETKPYPLFPVYEYYEDIRQPVASSLEQEQTVLNPRGRKVPRVLPGSSQEPYPGQHFGLPAQKLRGRPRRIA